MNVPEIFKYNSLISFPLFAIITFVLVKNSTDYSFHIHTISKSIHFLNNPIQNIIFRLNFISKALLDFGFALFVVNHFKISFDSVIFLTLLLSAFLFSTLAFFVEGKYSTSHNIATYTSGVLWVIGQISVARLVNDPGFTVFSMIFLSVPIILAFGYLFTKKTNVVVQAVCASIWYIWLLVFVFRHLL